MMPNYDDLDLMLIRYFSGQLSAAERADVEQAHGPELERLHALWEASAQPAVQPDVDAALCRLKAARAQRAQRPVLTFPSQATKSSTAIRIFRIAAAIVVLLAGGLVWRSVDRSGGVPESAAVAMVEHRTERGQRRDLRLPDGTRVVLNVDSRIRIAANYGKNSREVYVEGEALFDVTHDEQRPFRVHAGGAIAEDLGTRFGVRNYSGDTAVVVIVAEGSVEFKSTSQSAKLDPNQLASMNSAGAVSVTRDVDAAALLGWSEGRLLFAKATLRDAALQLGRWYNIDVRLGDSALADLRVNGSFGDEPVSQVIELIALSLDLRYERSGRVVTFYQKRSAR